MFHHNDGPLYRVWAYGNLDYNGFARTLAGYGATQSADGSWLLRTPEHPLKVMNDLLRWRCPGDRAGMWTYGMDTNQSADGRGR